MWHIRGGEDKYIQGFGGENWGRGNTWEDNIERAFQEEGEGAWTGLTWDSDRRRAVVYVVMNVLVLQSAKNFLTSLGCVSSPGKALLHDAWIRGVDSAFSG